MYMPRVVEWQIVLKNHTDCLICSKVEDIPFWIKRVADIAFVCESKHWMIVVCSERLPIDQIQGMACRVYRLSDLDCDGRVWLLHWNLIEGLCIRQRIS